MRDLVIVFSFLWPHVVHRRAALPAVVSSRLGSTIVARDLLILIRWKGGGGGKKEKGTITGFLVLGWLVGEISKCESIIPSRGRVGKQHSI